jgi:hypothetical protein
MRSLTWTRRTRPAAHGPKSRSGRPPDKHTTIRDRQALPLRPNPFVTMGKQDKTGNLRVAGNVVSQSTHDRQPTWWCIQPAGRPLLWPFSHLPGGHGVDEVLLLVQRVLVPGVAHAIVRVARQQVLPHTTATQPLLRGVADDGQGPSGGQAEEEESS